MRRGSQPGSRSREEAKKHTPQLGIAAKCDRRPGQLAIAKNQRPQSRGIGLDDCVGSTRAAASDGDGSVSGHRAIG